jgi:hypothetical protein
MNKQKKLPAVAAGFLLVVALIADGTKFALDFLFGIGIVLDPIFITPLTTLVFWITLNHNNISMFSGKNWASAWVNEVVSFTPGIDALPDWTVYTIYLIAQNRVSDLTQGIMS